MWRTLLLLLLAQCAFGADAWETYGSEGKRAFEEKRFADAERLLKASLKEARAFGEHDRRLALCLNNLAAVYEAQQKWADAEPLLREAMKVVGADNADAADHLGTNYVNQGRHADAEPLLRRALALREKSFGPADKRVAESLNNLAALFFADGKLKEAEPLLRRAVAIEEKALAPNDPVLAETLENYSVLLLELGRAEESARFADRAKTIRARAAWYGSAPGANSSDTQPKPSPR